MNTEQIIVIVTFLIGVIGSMLTAYVTLTNRITKIETQVKNMETSVEELSSQVSSFESLFDRHLRALSEKVEAIMASQANVAGKLDAFTAFLMEFGKMNKK